MMYFNPVAEEAKKAADLGLMLGVLGFFVLGIILGPLAIYYGMKARRLDPSKGMAGIALGSTVLILYIGILAFEFYLLMTMPFL